MGEALREGQPLREIFKLFPSWASVCLQLSKIIRLGDSPSLKTLGLEVGKIDNGHSVPQAKGKHSFLFHPPCPLSGGTSCYLQVLQILVQYHHPFHISQLPLSTLEECPCGVCSLCICFPSYKAVSNLRAADETGPGT